MLPVDFIALAIALRFAAGASYIKATWQGKAQPNLASWFLWSLTALIAFAVQLAKGDGPGAWATLAIGISPIVVCAVALYRRSYVTTFSTSDKLCVAFSTAGIALWLISDDPFIALAMSMTADMFSNIPTILKSYRAPHTEHATAYAISAASMAVTLLTINNWQLVNWLFTAYILAVNVTFVLIITVISKLRFAWAARRPDVFAYQEIGIEGEQAFTSPRQTRDSQRQTYVSHSIRTEITPR